MRIVSIIDGLGTGGAERSLAEIAIGLGERGHVVDVVCLYARSGAHEDLVDAGIDVRVLSARSFLGRVREFRRLVDAAQPDVVHSTLYASNLVARFSLIGRTCHLVTSLVNVRYDVDRLDLLSPLQRLKYRLARGLDELSARRLTHHFHAITHVVASDHRERYRLGDDDITVIPRGRDLDRFHPAASQERRALRRRFGFHDDEVVILSLGRQETQKGQIHLVDAARDLPVEGVRVVLAGREGSESKRLEAALRTGEGCRVELLGYRRDVVELLQAADIFVFPSLWEGLGGALIEAMATGLPIVASDIPAVAEVVVDGVNADLVPPRDSSALAVALRSMIDDSGRRHRFGAASSDRFLRNYEAGIVNDQLIKMISACGATATAPVNQ